MTPTNAKHIFIFDLVEKQHDLLHMFSLRLDRIYMPTSKSQTCLIHHWKSVSQYIVGLKKAEVSDSQNSKLELEPKETKISNFTLFFKTEFSDCQFKRLFLYISIIVVLGMIASAIISIISSFIPNNYGYEWAVWCIFIISITLLVSFSLYKSTKK